MANGSKGEYAYTIAEVSSDIPASLSEMIGTNDEIIRVRVI
jgi:hypothetical protein